MKTQRVLYVDATAGASGDMILGALVDLGVSLLDIRRAVETLPLRGWHLSSRKVERAHLAGRKVRVRVEDHGPPRGWHDIRRIIERGKLASEVRDRALEIFHRLIEAEARAHGLHFEKIHLHEAGAVDAIIDVVGACVGLSRIAPHRIIVSPLTTGFGTTRCVHGTYPVPGPATTALILGVPVMAGDIQSERLTPTGAAILTTIADEWGPMPLLRPSAVGYGAGDRDFQDYPNLLRMILGETVSTDAASDFRGSGETSVLTFTLDDAPPQVVAYASERLFEAGAMEVYTTPVHMKKGRSGHQVTVLGRSEDLRVLADTALRETTTLGVRFHRESRIELDRSIARVRTSYGWVKVKVGSLEGRPLHAWPEYEDCAEIARRRGVSLQEVQQAALEAHRSAAVRTSARRET